MMRTTVRAPAACTGRAPGAASTTARCTVFEPMSRTPRRVVAVTGVEGSAPRRARPPAVRGAGAPRILGRPWGHGGSTSEGATDGTTAGPGGGGSDGRARDDGRVRPPVAGGRGGAVGHRHPVARPVADARAH